VTIKECIKYGVDTIGQRDTMLLMCHILEKSSAYVMLNDDALLKADEEAKFFSYANRYKQNEPLQYIIGEWDFMGQTLRTDSRALIPRPETELLVEDALKFLHKRTCDNPHSISVLDMCTGSGCIAVSVAKAGYAVTAADISHAALSLAAENTKRLGFDINFIESNLFDKIEGKFDVIISNPPYITSKEMDILLPSVLNYEPHLALSGGDDGMDIYRSLIPQSVKYLKPGGALFLEIGPPAVENIMNDAGFKNVELKNDYAGLPRIVWGLAPFIKEIN